MSLTARFAFRGPTPPHPAPGARAPTPMHAALAALVMALAGPLTVQAAGSASSVASQGSSASVGSVSDSIQQSSQSSNRDNRVAEGRYRIEAVDAVPGDGERVRLALVPVDRPGAVAAGAQPFALVLPRAAYEASRLGAGDEIRATERPYGVEFARWADGQAFFLALDDAARHDLRTRPIAG